MTRSPKVLIRKPNRRCRWTRVFIPACYPFCSDVLAWLRRTYGPSTFLTGTLRKFGPSRPDARWALVKAPLGYSGVVRFVVMFDDLDSAILRLAFDTQDISNKPYLNWRPCPRERSYR